MSSSEPKIVAILQRNADGELERVDDADIRETDGVTFIQTRKGVVVVIGRVSERDEPAVARLLECL